MNPAGRATRATTAAEQANLSAVCRHLALVAVDGATGEVAATLTPDFRLHADTLDTDRSGYLALIAANHAAHVTRPPLDVAHAEVRREFVTVRLDPHCIAHYRLRDGIIAEAWMTTDWRIWRDWLLRHMMT